MAVFAVTRLGLFAVIAGQVSCKNTQGIAGIMLSKSFKQFQTINIVLNMFNRKYIYIYIVVYLCIYEMPTAEAMQENVGL